MGGGRGGGGRGGGAALHVYDEIGIPDINDHIIFYF